MRALWHSPTIRSTVVLGTAGAGFTGGRLVRALSAMYYTARHLRFPHPAPALTP